MRVAVLALLAACEFHHGSLGLADGGGDDGPRDGISIDAAPGCFGTSNLGVVCPSVPPSSELRFTANTTIDTDDPEMCATLNPDVASVCALAGTSITIVSGVTVRGTGTRPLVLATPGAIAIAGTLDVASHRGGTIGAGGNSSSCVAGTGPSNRGGGWGGSYGSHGGDGGDSNGVDDNGVHGATISATPLHGGCPGADGGLTPGLRGNGGGAVLLIASAINVSGTINASGSGGGATPSGKTGGAGGGSGGTIAFDAPSLSISGQVFANGGGGAGGSGNGAGTAGQDPTVAGNAMGGPGGSSAGDGGNGSLDLGTGGTGTNGTNSTDGGGGGGGGAGLVLRFQHTGTVGSGMVMPPLP